MSNQHVLKIHPAPLADLLSGAKTAEVRRNDRGFQVGDTVRLMEADPETGNWTGAADHVRTISHIQTGYGLPDGLCVLSYAQAEQQEAQGAQARDERAAFERKVQDLAERFQPDYRRYGDAGEYKDATLEWAWKLWQARAALAPQPAAGEQLSEVAKQNAILEQIKSGLEGVLYPPAAGEPVDGVEGFACWLIDHCEGYEIFEEKIQDWVADYLKSDAYQRISAPPAAAHGDEAVLWELLEELRTATDRQALPGEFIRVMWEAGCDWINARAAMRAKGDDRLLFTDAIMPGGLTET